MNAPDKIYLHGYDFDKEPCNKWDREPRVKGMRGYPAKHVEYIRKDFLLEWAEQEKSKTSIGLSEYDAGHENARMKLLNDLIDKINTL